MGGWVFLSQNYGVIWLPEGREFRMYDIILHSPRFRATIWLLDILYRSGTITSLSRFQPICTA